MLCPCLKHPTSPVLGCSNSLRVIHPDVVVIGLLCEHVARTFASRLWICVCMCYCTNRCCEDRKKNVLKKTTTKQQQQWVNGMGSQRSIPTVDVQAISRLFHELLTAKLFCVSHNQNNGERCGKLRERGIVCVSVSSLTRYPLSVSELARCLF